MNKNIFLFFYLFINIYVNSIEYLPILDQFLSNYKRPITILDLNTIENLQLFDLEKKYDITIVRIEEDINKINDQIKLINKNFNNIILLNEKLNIPKLELLSQCEHFDIVIATETLNLDFDLLLNILYKLGDFIFVNSQKLNKDKCKTLNIFQEFNSITILKSFQNTILKRHIFWPYTQNIDDVKTHIVISNFLEKKLEKKHLNEITTTNWEKGINLVTFKFFNGIFPSIDNLIIYLQNNTFNFQDFTPSNLIIQGTQILKIDNEGFPTNSLNLIIEFLKLNDKKDLRRFYYKNFFGI